MGKMISITGQPLEEKTAEMNGEIVEIPDFERDDFVRNYIEDDLDNRPEDLTFNKILEESEKEFDVIPSYKSYEEWVIDKFDNYETAKIFYDLLSSEDKKDWNINRSSGIKHVYRQYLIAVYDTPELQKEYNENYIKEYRTELREWYLRRRQPGETTLETNKVKESVATL